MVKKDNDALGIIGFTLGIAGFLVLLFNPFPSLILFIAGLVFCIVQQRRKKSKLGMVGLILNIIGIIAAIILLIVILTYLYPALQRQLSSLPVSQK